MGFIFFKGPKSKGDKSLNTNIPIISPTLFSFLSPNKNDGLMIVSLEKSNFFKKIKDLIPIVANCDLYIGNDSFGHHITSQCGIPSLILLLDTPRAYTDYSINPVSYTHLTLPTKRIV